MTVAIAVLTADGIAVAADSRTTWSNGSVTRVLSDSTRKVFSIGHVAVATYGWAFLENKNIAGNWNEFVVSLSGDEPPGVVAQKLAAFMGDRLDAHISAGHDDPIPEGHDALGFLVAGYEEGVGSVFDVSLPSRSVVEVVGSVGGAAWRGQTDVIMRLIKGIDLFRIGAALEGADYIDTPDLQARLETLEYVIPFSSMNLQDAIDFAVLAIRTTIDVQRLTYGTVSDPESWPGVGGPILIAAITPGGLEWVRPPELQGERPAGAASDG